MYDGRGLCMLKAAVPIFISLWLCPDVLQAQDKIQQPPDGSREISVDEFYRRVKKDVDLIENPTSIVGLKQALKDLMSYGSEAAPVFRKTLKKEGVKQDLRALAILALGSLKGPQDIDMIRGLAKNPPKGEGHDHHAWWAAVAVCARLGDELPLNRFRHGVLRLDQEDPVEPIQFAGYVRDKKCTEGLRWIISVPMVHEDNQQRVRLALEALLDIQDEATFQFIDLALGKDHYDANEQKMRADLARGTLYLKTNVLFESLEAWKKWREENAGQIDDLLQPIWQPRQRIKVRETIDSEKLPSLTRIGRPKKG